MKPFFTNRITRISLVVFSLAVLLLIFIKLDVFTPLNQKSKEPNKLVHQTFAKAQAQLDAITPFLLSDSLLINNEKSRIASLYKSIGDRLLENSNSTAYALFTYKRYLQMSYSSQKLPQLRQYHDSLIHLVATYPKVLESDSIANDIAKGIVNSFEMGTITRDSVLLSEVAHIINEHINIVYGKGTSILQKQKTVKLYAKQYYNRGMISMAEQVFTLFKHLYNKQTKVNIKPIRFANNYPVYDKNGITNQTINSTIPIKIIAFNQDTTDYNLVYLINIIRASLKEYPYAQFIIARNPKLLNDAYVQAIGRNIAGNIHYINLSEADINYYKTSASFVVVMPNNQIAYNADNSVDFLEWLKHSNQEQREVAKQLPKPVNKDNHTLAAPDTLLKYKKNFGNMQLRLKGYWPDKLSATLQTYSFTNAVVRNTQPKTDLYTIDIYNNKNLIHRQLLIEPNKKHKTEVVIMLADADHNINTSFTVPGLNNRFIELKNKLMHQQDTLQFYKRLIDEYPYPTSNFIVEMKTRRDKKQFEVNAMLSGREIIPQIKTLLKANQVIFNLHQSKAKQKITYNDFTRLIPFTQADTILYNSPYYKQIIDAWLQFGSNDPVSSVDLLFSSEIMIPDEVTSIVGKYLWKHFNAIGREDIMMHIDTMYLSGCAAENNISVKQRLEGYKRMAVGKKAPDITWIENGKEKHLYELKADTVLIVFWADWCPHCKETLPQLYRKTSSYNSNIEVVAINIDDDESSQQLGYRLMSKWHHVRAPGKWDDAIIEKWNVFGTPTIYILNNDMIILKKN